MKNFYNDADREGVAKTGSPTGTTVDIYGDALPRTSNKPWATSRPDFAIDRDRILHSPAFRRLQGKTQVFLSGQYDFYRNRLTHSIEVAQIGRAIAYHLSHQPKSPIKHTTGISAELVEACCLAHDIGNPPFGHAGEEALNEIMSSHGGFEGNAQTLREITDLLWRTGVESRGMNPSRAFADGVLKYKRCAPRKVRRGDSKFLYHDQARVLDEICGGWPRGVKAMIAAHNRQRTAAGAKKSRGRLMSRLKSLRSLECQIMDWADETAYGLFDLVDGFRGKFITPDQIHAWIEERGGKLTDPAHRALRRLAAVLEEASRGSTGALSEHVARAIGRFIAATSLQRREKKFIVTGGPQEKSNRYKYCLHIEEEIAAVQKAFADLAAELVFQTPQVKQLEWKAAAMMRRLYDCLTDNYLSASPKQILARHHHKMLVAAGRGSQGGVPRLVCDYIAGMTDGFFLRVYGRLFEPRFGSITDLA
jgi:dGTPase